MKWLFFGWSVRLRAFSRIVQRASLSRPRKMSAIANNHASQQLEQDEEILDGENCFHTINWHLLIFLQCWTFHRSTPSLHRSNY